MAMLTAEERVARAIDLFERGAKDGGSVTLRDVEKALHLASRLEGLVEDDHAAPSSAKRQALQGLAVELQSLSPEAQAAFHEQSGYFVPRRYEQDLYAVLPSPSKGLNSKWSRHDRAEEILAKATSVFAHYEPILDLSPPALRESLHSINRQALTAYASDFGHAVSRDMAQSRFESVTRDALLVLGLEQQWCKLVYQSAIGIMEEKVLQTSPSAHTHNGSPDDSLDLEEEALPSLQTWLQYAVFDVLEAWEVPGRQHISQQTTFQLLKTLGGVRARQLFDIISDFPASSPALQDLIRCGEAVEIKSYVSQQLGMALKARLLHPGASTRDIIQFYTHLIRSLRYVDPSGVILSHVIGPVRSYLRARSDTIPVIVAGLLGQAGDFTLLRDMMRDTADLSSLQRVGAMADTSVTIYDESNVQDRDGIQVDIAAMDESKRMVFVPEPDDDWAPRPVDAGPDYRQSRKSDVIAIIVSIFDDEEGFVAALERSCAEQIIKVRDYDTTREYEMNENLKKRFGDASMGKCDVMLNDVKRSQRTDRRVHRMVSGDASDPADLPPASSTGLADLDGSARELLDALHPLILSRQFWPLIKEDDVASVPSAFKADGVGGAFGAGADQRGHAASSMMFASNVRSDAAAAGMSVTGEGAQQLPAPYNAALEAYQSLFPSVVHGRKLRWLPGRSVVRVEVELDDGRRLDERVTPLQAAILQHVAATTAGSTDATQVTFTIAALASHLAVPDNAVRQSISYWVSCGVLSEVVVDTYSLLTRTT